MASGLSRGDLGGIAKRTEEVIGCPDWFSPVTVIGPRSVQAGLTWSRCRR